MNWMGVGQHQIVFLSALVGDLLGSLYASRNFHHVGNARWKGVSLTDDHYWMLHGHPRPYERFAVEARSE